MRERKQKKILPAVRGLGFADESSLLFFSLDSSTRQLIALSGSTQQVLGCSSESLLLDGGFFLRHLHEDDRFQLLEKLEQSIEWKTPLFLTYRWIRPDTSFIQQITVRAAHKKQKGSSALTGCLLSNEYIISSPEEELKDLQSLEHLAALTTHGASAYLEQIPKKILAPEAQENLTSAQKLLQRYLELDRRLKSSPTSPNSPKIILVEKDQFVSQALSSILEDADFCVSQLPSVEKIFDSIDSSSLPDLIILDDPETDGSVLQVLDTLRNMYPLLPIIVITSPRVDRTNRLLGMGIEYILWRPVDGPTMLAKIRKALNNHERVQAEELTV